MTFRGDAVDAASHGLEFLVAHLMTAYARVIPIRDEDGSVGRGAYVGGTIPIVVAREQVLNLRFVTSAVHFDAVAANDARACVAVNHAVAKILQEVAFVKQNSCRRTVSSLQ